jgi:hypothetical protein
MKKNVFLSILCAICALAITFVACNKDTEEGTKKAHKSGTLADKGIYECIDPGLYELNENAVKSHNAVSNRTTFVNGDVWIAQKADIYKISVTKGGTEYSSFCGAYISNGFGESVEYSSAALEPVKKAQIISALNYIYDNYGSLNGWMEDDYGNPNRPPVSPENSTYVVAQCVIWMILDYIDADGNLVQPQNGIVSVYPEYSNPGYYDYGPYINRGFEAVIDAVYAAATNGYTGSKTVNDLAYLVGPNYPSDINGWQPQIIPLGGVEPVCVEFTKVVWAPNLPNGRAIVDGEFSFQLWEKVGTTYSNTGKTSFTRLNGKIEFCDLADGNYQIREIATGNWEAQTIDFSIVNGVPNYPKGQVITNKPKTGPSYGSVTATNTNYKDGGLYSHYLYFDSKNDKATTKSYTDGLVVYNSNHFTFAKLNYADLTAGNTIELAMVVGNKVDRVGTAYVKLVNGKLEVTIEGFAKGNFGVMAFNKPMTSNMPKNGNIHSQKEADLMSALGSTTGFNHNNKLEVPCPANLNGTIYLYIHCGDIQYYLPVQ